MQRRRTRKAILAAAAELIGEGHEPSVTEIANRADVSRRTVYLYFPTLEHLLIDATLGALTETTVDRAVANESLADDPHARLDALIDAMYQNTAETISLGRALIRLTVDARGDATTPRRGYRRVEWIQQALEPVRAQVDEATLERLVSALSMILGWEGMIVLRDVRALDEEAELEVTRWSAHALLDAALRPSSP